MKGNVKKTLFVLGAAMSMVFAMSITAFAGTPTNLRQAAVNSNHFATTYSAGIMWDDAAGGTGIYYGIELSKTANFAQKEQYVTQAKGGIIPDYLDDATKYYVRVGFGTSRETCFANFCAPILITTAPKDVDNTKFVNATDTSVTLTWDAVAGADGYAVDYAGSVIPVTTNAATIPFKAGYTKAYVYAFCKNGAGDFAYSSVGDYIYGFSALTTKVATKNFGIATWYSSIRELQIGCTNYYGSGFDAKVAPVQGRGSKTATSNIIGKADVGKLKANTMYKYQVRPYVTFSNGTKKYGAWSAYRYILSSTAKVGRVYGGIKVVIPKQKGAKKAVISISTKEKSGFKKCATISNLNKQKSFVIKKIGNKYLKKNSSYYVKVEYYANNKTQSKYVSDVYGQLRVYYW